MANTKTAASKKTARPKRTTKKKGKKVSLLDAAIIGANTPPFAGV
jgi:hypothetical protein